jgi:hypothetical protein
MDLFRVLCNGVMALSVSSFAGWLYSAHPSDVSRVAIKAMDMVGPIVTPRAKKPPVDIVRLPPPNSQALPNLAPSAKSATLASTRQPPKPNTKPAGKAVAKAAASPKRPASKPLVKSDKPQIAAAAKNRRVAAVYD